MLLWRRPTHTQVRGSGAGDRTRCVFLGAPFTTPRHAPVAADAASAGRRRSLQRGTPARAACSHAPLPPRLPPSRPRPQARWSTATGMSATSTSSLLAAGRPTTLRRSGTPTRSTAVRSTERHSGQRLGASGRTLVNACVGPRRPYPARQPGEPGPRPVNAKGCVAVAGMLLLASRLSVWRLGRWRPTARASQRNLPCAPRVLSGALALMPAARHSAYSDGRGRGRGGRQAVAPAPEGKGPASTPPPQNGAHTRSLAPTLFTISHEQHGALNAGPFPFGLPATTRRWRMWGPAAPEMLRA
jgi:hypothetical protein